MPEIRTRRIVVEDVAGRERVLVDAEQGIQICDRQGRALISLELLDDPDDGTLASITVGDEGKGPSISLRAYRDGSNLGLGIDGLIKAMLGIHALGEPILWLGDGPRAKFTPRGTEYSG